MSLVCLFFFFFQLQSLQHFSVTAEISSNTEELVGKVSIYTRNSHTDTIQSQNCTHVSVCPDFFSVVSCDSLAVSHSHRQKQRGEVSGAVAGAGAPMM